MPRMAKVRSCFVAIGWLILAGGCSQHSENIQANSASALDRGLSSAQASDAGQVDSQKKEIDDLVARAMTRPGADQSTAAALAVSDGTTAQLGSLLHGLEGAEEVVLNNLRNADTTGFKATRMQSAENNPLTTLDMSQGAMRSTGNSLDVGIQGDGFFRVALPDGSPGNAYTRNGSFFINEKSQLVLGMGEGYRLIPPITIPANSTDIKIGQDGMVTVQNAGTGAVVQCGEIQLVRFANPAGLTMERGVLMETTASGPPIVVQAGKGTAGCIMQNFLEASNVDLSGENVRLRFLRNWRTYVLHAIDVHTDPSNATLARFRE